MNADRRKTLTAIEAQITNLRDRLDELMNEEQDAFDNMPESLADGERGQAMEEAIQAMEEALSSLEDACSSIQEARGE